MKRRAAVVIGVNEGGKLTPLKSAARTALSVARWLVDSDPGYDVTLLNDGGLNLDGSTSEPQPVRINDVQDAVYRYVTIPPRYDMFVIYYCGHGLFTSRHDVWLLNRAPERPTEAISVNSSVDLAQVCGISTVVFVSDACRNTDGSLTLQQLTPCPIFPNHSELQNSVCKVDIIRATLRGAAAYEIPIEGEVFPLLSHALRRAYKTPDRTMVTQVELNGTALDVVPNRRLESFLQARVDAAIDKADLDIEQIVYLNIPSDDDTFIAPVDPAGVADASRDPTPDLSAAEAYTRKLPRSGFADDLKQIKGIGPVLEGRLHRVGVFRLTQIAGWTDDELGWIDERLGLRNRIERDDWIAQARERLRSDDRQERPAKRTATPTTPRRRTLRKVASTFGVAPAPSKPNTDDSTARFGASQARSAAKRIISGEKSTSELRETVDFWQPPSSAPGHFESACGFTIYGARLHSVAQGHGAGTVEILSHGDGGIEPAIVRVWHATPCVQIGSILEDGRSLLIPALQGYIGHYLVTASGLSQAVLMPSDNTWRWQSYELGRDKVDFLRAAATKATDGGKFFVGSAREAEKLAAMLRQMKSLDPVLGLLAAWSYYEAGYRDKVLSVRDYMRNELSADLFDVRLLASRQPWPANEPCPVVPGCPILTSGWHILGARNVTLPPRLAAGVDHLAGSLYTTFQPPFSDQLLLYLQEDRDR